MANDRIYRGASSMLRRPRMLGRFIVPLMQSALCIGCFLVLGHASGAPVNPMLRNITIVDGQDVLDKSYTSAESPLEKADEYDGQFAASVLNSSVFDLFDNLFPVFAHVGSSLGGTHPAAAQAIANGGYNFTLPASGNSKMQGGKLVLSYELGTRIMGDGFVSLVISNSAFIGSTFVAKTGATSISNLGDTTQGIDIVFDLPANFDSTKPIQGSAGLAITSVANISPSPGVPGAIFSSAVGNVFIKNFRVLDSAGVQVTGFGPITTTEGSPIKEFAPPVPPPVREEIAYEFYNRSQDKFFMTSDPVEIALLPSSAFPGWLPTGEGFNAISADAAAAAVKSVAVPTSPVCRFYIPPEHGDSHFFSADPAQCQQVLDLRATNPSFSGYIEETANAFLVYLPDLVTGACPAGTIPIYRLWNRRFDSNHRYTANPSIKAQMVAKGYAPEGYGPNAVAMCSPQ